MCGHTHVRGRIYIYTHAHMCGCTHTCVHLCIYPTHSVTVETSETEFFAAKDKNWYQRGIKELAEKVPSDDATRWIPL